jgi:hypothetical protein
MTAYFHPSLALISRIHGKKVLARKPQERRCLGISSLIFSFFTIPLLLSVLGRVRERERDTGPETRKKGKEAPAAVVGHGGY